MPQYQICSVIKESISPDTPFDVAFIKSHSFEADNDEAAIAYVNLLQNQHSEKYKDADADISDYLSSPVYSLCTFRIEGKNKVQLQF